MQFLPPKLIMGTCAALVGAQPLAAAPAAQNDPLETTQPTESAEPTSKPGDKDFRVYWKEGIRFETTDKSVRMQIGGRIMNDWGWFTGDLEDATGVSTDDGTEFRRARINIKGDLYENMSFKAEYDFAAGSGAAFNDIYIVFKDLIGAPLKVGHFKEPIGLEQLTSSKYGTFLERAAGLEPARNSGIMAQDTWGGERGTWAAGVFRNTGSFGRDTGEGDYAFTARGTWLPMWKENGDLVHLGLSYSFRQDDNDVTRVRARADAHIPDPFLDTGEFAADSTDLISVESAWVNGPLSLQAEYKLGMIDSSAADDPDVSTWYFQGSYFLTGEHRSYNKSNAVFGRVKPKRNKGKEGNGAVEIAARFSVADLNDGNLTPAFDDNNSNSVFDAGDLSRGLSQSVITLGLNWYLNPNSRVQFNLSHVEIDDIALVGGGSTDADGDFFQIRFQVDF